MFSLSQQFLFYIYCGIQHHSSKLDFFFPCLLLRATNLGEIWMPQTYSVDKSIFNNLLRNLHADNAGVIVNPKGEMKGTLMNFLGLKVVILCFPCCFDFSLSSLMRSPASRFGHHRPNRKRVCWSVAQDCQRCKCHRLEISRVSLASFVLFSSCGLNWL